MVIQAVLVLWFVLITDIFTQYYISSSHTDSEIRLINCDFIFPLINELRGSLCSSIASKNKPTILHCKVVIPSFL